MTTTTPIRSRLLCLIIACLAAATLAWGQGKGKGKPPKTPPAPPANAFLAFDSNDDLWLSDGVDCGLLVTDAIQPTWSPDGTEIAFSREDPTTGWGIYRVPADGSGPPQLVTLYPTWGGYTPSWFHIDWSPAATPTGHHMILFAAYPPGEVDMQLYAVRPDGTDMVRFTWDQDYYSDPHWGPSGSRFTVSRIPDPLVSGQAIMVYDVGVGSSGLLEITGGIPITHVPGSLVQNMRNAFSPAFSNDGNWVVCRLGGGLAGGGNDDLIKIEVNDPSVVIPLTFDATHRHHGPKFSTDDTQVIFNTASRGNRQSLATVDAWGGSPVPVFLTPGFKASQWYVDIKP